MVYGRRRLLRRLTCTPAEATARSRSRSELETVGYITGWRKAPTSQQMKVVKQTDTVKMIREAMHLEYLSE